MARSTLPLSPTWTKLWDGEEREKGIEKEKEDKIESLRERDTTFSLDFLVIGSAVSGGARERVHPHCKGFA